jgi:predicted CXXCH cytochrome family protein
MTAPTLRTVIHKEKRLRRSFKSFFLISLLILAVGAVSVAEELSGEDGAIGNPHIDQGKGKCAVCHTQRPPQLRDDHVETCTNCHIGNIENHPVTRHPIDVGVKIKIPTPLPLAIGDRIVCSTCHDPHDDHGFSSMLRVEYHQLCVQCHRGY